MWGICCSVAQKESTLCKDPEWLVWGSWFQFCKMLSQNKKGTYLQNVRVLKSTFPEVPDDLIHFGLSLS